MIDRRRVRAAHRQRPVAEGRRLGVLLGRRPAHPRPPRLPVRQRRHGRHRRPRPGRAPAHPRVPAADPVHAEGRHLRGARLGGRRRAQPARRVRPHPGQRRARPVQADRRRRRQLRRRLRLGVPRPLRRPEVRPRDLLPRPGVHRRADARDGRRQRRRAARRARGDGAAVGPRDLRQVAHRAADAEVLVQPDRRRPRRPADLRRRGDPPGVRSDEAAEGRDAFLEKRPPDWSPFPYYY